MNTLNVQTYSSDDATSYYQQLAEEGLFVDEQLIVDQYFPRDGARVLDLGCGAGRTVTELVERGYEVVGIDISEPMIDVATESKSDANYCVADAATLPFADSTFEYALFSFNGIDYLKPEEKRLDALSEIRRVLRSGGRLAFNSHNMWYFDFFHLNPLDADSWREMWQWWRRAIRQASIRSSYRREFRRYGDTYTYFIDPLSQKQQLQKVGFNVLAVVGNEDGHSHVEPWPYHVYFDRFPYYVAEKHP